MTEAPATKPEDIAGIDFPGEDFDVADLLADRAQTIIQWQTLWMMVGTLKDDKATLTARMVRMEEGGVSMVFLSSLDTLVAENKRIGEILDRVHDRILVASAAAVIELEAKAE